MNQTEIASKIKVLLHNVPCTKEHDTDFEKTTTLKYAFLTQT